MSLMLARLALTIQRLAAADAAAPRSIAVNSTGGKDGPSCGASAADA
eukprot:SAG31_NODE_817_length_11849_cov_6.737362_3_plen_47_part_00